jgi:oligopeptide/dipeptide ABC transporter ATP-binding protein
MTQGSAPLLDVCDLRVSFGSERGAITAVDGVSLVVPRGQTVALVGESGCGKSVTALSIMRLLPEPGGRITDGRILLRESPEGDAVDLARVDETRMQRIRGGRIAMILQEPLTALNPVLTIGRQIIEAIELHQELRGRGARDEAISLLRRVGIADPHRRVDSYPHQLSGGMRQRAMIAMALACKPAVLIADEPTTALDVTVQAQILALLHALQAQTGMSILLITHDLGIVAHVADFVYVMYAGRIVEHASQSDLFAGPLHPYTQGLLRCTPRIADARPRLEAIPGVVPDPAARPLGCRFHPRCPLTVERAAVPGRTTIPISATAGTEVLARCVKQVAAEPSGDPPLREVHPGHFVACWEADVAMQAGAIGERSCAQC